MSLTSEKINQNWETLQQLIKDTFDKDRIQNLNTMYAYFENRMILAPASGINYYHNCFPGGYVDHVLRVIDCATNLYELWSAKGANIQDYTREELIFSAMHHDLGKVGDLENDYYIPNKSEWHRKNQGKIYDHNPELHFMNVSDRSIWLLNQFNIKVSINELLGIKLADGLYEESNLRYFKAYTKDKQLKTNLPIIIHHADMMAMRVEHESVVVGNTKPIVDTVKPNQQGKKHKINTDLKKQFDELFK